jgi:hypothetical protein
MFGFSFLQSRGHAGANHTARANMTPSNLFFPFWLIVLT